MFLATHPLVNIVAHPWWWSGGWADAAGDKAVEINLEAILLNPHYPRRFVAQYLDYLARLKEAGVRFSIGSDCHDSHYKINFAAAEAMLASVNITNRDLWRLPRAGQPSVGGSATERSGF